MALDHTHDAARRSWVASANDGVTDFPIQNLPLGVFTVGADEPRCGVAIGDQILDLGRASARGLIRPDLVQAVRQPNLDQLFARGRSAVRALRCDAFACLDAEMSTPDTDLLHPMIDCVMRLPTTVRSFTDFFAGVHHAVRSGEVAGRPDDPLPANYHHMPLGYNGRASTVRVSGAEVRRPLGLRKRLEDAEPSFGASQWLDFELELGFFVGPGNDVGDPIPLAQAAEHIVGYCLLNDWSARDIQLFEMAPLGAFNSKSFSTSISPWIVTADALEPFRGPAMPRFPGSPPLVPYLDDAADREQSGLEIALCGAISTARMRADGEPPAALLSTSARHLYWTCSQIVAHQSICGCSLTPGDLIGTGTISGPSPPEYASLFELSVGGRAPLVLPNGERRAFLEDGDEVSISGRCERVGFASIGFGTCVGRIAPAPHA